MQSTLDQPQLVEEMKANIDKLCESIKYSVDKGAMITHQHIEGIDELCPEISKYVSILSTSVRIINHVLCQCAANQLRTASISVLDGIHELFVFIQHSTRTDDEKQSADKRAVNTQRLTTLVGIIWNVK